MSRTEIVDFTSGRSFDLELNDALGVYDDRVVVFTTRDGCRAFAEYFRHEDLWQVCIDVNS